MPIVALEPVSVRAHGYLAPVGPVYQAGTLSRNPLSVAAGITTLTLADAAVYAHLDSLQPGEALTEAFNATGVDHSYRRR